MAIGKVFIVGGRTYSEYAEMFSSAGWEITNRIATADLLQFCGGADVSPDYYGMGKHHTTMNDPLRDDVEATQFIIGLEEEIPMAGICRGGQFLNVMCGGQMWQHVDGHAIGRGHNIQDLIDEDVFFATSTHHQMMIPAANASVLAVAYEASRYETVDKDGKAHNLTYAKKEYNKDGDPEVVFYPIQRALCFQPHPEFDGVPMLKARYFKYIGDYLFSDRKKAT